MGPRTGRRIPKHIRRSRGKDANAVPDKAFFDESALAGGGVPKEEITPGL